VIFTRRSRHIMQAVVMRRRFILSLETFDADDTGIIKRNKNPRI
jgi:hypothetical protein